MTAHSPLRCANAGMARLPSASQKTVLLDPGAFPGYSNYVNETWTWNGTDWTNVSATTGIDPNGPLPTRLNFVMSFDNTNIMMFGGQTSSETGGLLQDTWLWNGTAWAKQTLTTSPFGRYFAEACQLTITSNIVVMFGGSGSVNQAEYLLETWEWNGSTKAWALQSFANGASPAARIGHCMDGGTAFLVMFGGQGTNQLFNDTWKFDGASWTQLTPTTPPSARSGAVMAYDQTHNNWVLFGGENYYNYLPETWILNSGGTAWTKQTPATSPPGLTWSQMCWDTHTGTVLLFGGNSATDSYASAQTWSWNGTTWTQL